MDRTLRGLVGCALLLAFGGCGGVKVETNVGGTQTRGKALAGVSDEEDPANTESHCSTDDGRHDVSEYDTSGDEIPDVRKVFLRVGDGSLARLVLVCRESDLNSDGVKDVVRYYSNEGSPIKEEADRDFDGQMDEVTYFQDGRIMRQEFDTTGNGLVDMKVFFEAGKPLRAERDIGGRSTPEKWQADRWEYFEGGRMVRMGTDVDGDGKVDRWDRDADLRRAPNVESGATDASG